MSFFNEIIKNKNAQIGLQISYRFFVEGALPPIEFQFIKLSYIASTIGAKG